MGFRPFGFVAEDFCKGRGRWSRPLFLLRGSAGFGFLMYLGGPPFAVGVPLFDGPDGEALMLSNLESRPRTDTRGVPCEEGAAYLEAGPVIVV
jgi:hypothetical protein